MYLWEIPCRVIDESGTALFRVTSFGSVVEVEPAESAFASIRPLDVFGFVEPGSRLLGDDVPEFLVEDVLRSGEDVTGRAVVVRDPVGAVFVTTAIVTAPIRLVTAPA